MKTAVWQSRSHRKLSFSSFCKLRWNCHEICSLAFCSFALAKMSVKQLIWIFDFWQFFAVMSVIMLIACLNYDKSFFFAKTTRMRLLRCLPTKYCHFVNEFATDSKGFALSSVLCFIRMYLICTDFRRKLVSQLK